MREIEMVICFEQWFWGVRVKKSLVEAVDRRCLCGEWLCLEFLEVVKSVAEL